MKYILPVFLIIALAFGNTSCQKEFTIDAVDSTLITPPEVTGIFTAKIDGVKYTADKAAAAHIEFGFITITGVSKGGETIGFAVVDSGVNVYSLSNVNMNNGGVYAKDNELSYTTGEGNSPDESGGTVSITSINKDKKTISGTFTMKVFRELDSATKNITEGVFTDISYAEIFLPPASSKDTFKVKVDGNDFPVHSIISIKTGETIFINVNNQAADRTVGLILPTAIKAGTYKFEPFGAYIGQYNPSRTSYLPAVSGSLQITEHNTTTKRIKGTFAFEASEIMAPVPVKANLTEGYFALTYQ